MNSSNRRGFLKIAGVGVAAAGAATVLPSAVSTVGAPARDTVSAESPAVKLPAAAAGSMVAYINDVATGEISVMVEGREVTVTDHQLVAKLAHALHSSVSV